MPLPTDLLAWFDREKRDLPWRTPGRPGDPPPDPYAVWLSEIMLQQTRVETAIPYYRRFLARFPDVASLAAADEAELLTLWSGLGYYRRCRALLAAAKEVAASGGRFPSRAQELERLPGVGPYTAAAIASIAFAEVVPVLDGNVERVLSRFAARASGARSASDRTALRTLAAEFLDPARPGDSNQALMELGATVCTPRAPRCPECPLASGCAALRTGSPENFPQRTKRAPPQRVEQLVAVVEEGERLLLFRRSAGAEQLAALWEFPTVELSPGELPEGRLAQRFGGTWRLGERLLRLRHAITTRTYVIEVRRASFEGSGEILAEAPGEAAWWRRSELSALPLTGVARKLLAGLAPQPG